MRPDHPLLWRSDGRAQAGIGERTVPLGALTSADMAWLSGIDGSRDWAQVQAHADALGIAPARARRLLATLAAHGAIDDAGAMPDALRWRTRADRDAVWGDVAAAGFVYGSGATANVVIERRLAARIAVVGDGVLADALHDALADSGLEPADPSDAHLHIASVAHPVLATPVEHLPHLPVSVFGDTGRVGPLVVPGLTACLRCAHLHRRDADPSWPALVLQLEQAVDRMRPHPTDRMLARATATIAVLLVRRWADDPLAADAWAGHEVVVHLPDGATEHRALPPHALCGCRWPAARP